MNKTIDYYNKNAKAFASDTTDCKFNTIQDGFLSYLPQNSHILDLGCGAGRDSKYFKENGYTVTALDASMELCKMTENLINQKVICTTFQDMSFDNKFDGIWACASLLHLQNNELPEIIEKCLNLLSNNGVFYLSFKYGDFAGYKGDRYFTYLTEGSFNNIIKRFTGISIKRIFVSNDVRPNRENEKWLNVFVQKIN